MTALDPNEVDLVADASKVFNLGGLTGPDPKIAEAQEKRQAYEEKRKARKAERRAEKRRERRGRTIIPPDPLRGNDGRSAAIGTLVVKMPGAPPAVESWGARIKRLANMTRADLLQYTGQQAEGALAGLPDHLTLKDAVIITALTSLLTTPNGQLLNILMEREDGKLNTPITVNWEDEARRHGYDPTILIQNIVALLGSGAGTDQSLADQVRAGEGGEPAGPTAPGS